MKQFSSFLGALRYEFLMQRRRRAVWITFIAFFCLLLIELSQGSSRIDIVIPYALAHRPLQEVIAEWALQVSTYLPICVGALLADRLVRDRRIKVDELFTTMPATLNARLFGKYVGSMLATIIPMFLIYAGFMGYILYLTHNLLVIPLALLAFATIVLPGVLFASAFSLAVPMFIWVPLYQFLFICYWFWNTLWFHADIPNLGRTMLAPIGLYTAFGFYNMDRYQDTTGPHGDPGIHATPLQATLSMLLLVIIALLVMFTSARYIKWRQVHQ